MRWRTGPRRPGSTAPPRCASRAGSTPASPAHWVAHIRRLGRIQDETGGFTEFVPLPFVHQNSPIYLAGKARPGSTLEEDRRMHAVARVLLHGRIPNVQVSWVKLGMEECK